MEKTLNLILLVIGHCVILYYSCIFYLYFKLYKDLGLLKIVIGHYYNQRFSI